MRATVAVVLAAQHIAPTAAEGWFDGFKSVLNSAVGAVTGVVQADETYTVLGHRWDREQDVERFEEVQKENYCKTMDQDAYNVVESVKVEHEKKEIRKANDGSLYTLEEFHEFYGFPEQRVARDGTHYTWKEFKAFWKTEGKALREWEQAKIVKRRDDAKSTREWTKNMCNKTNETDCTEKKTVEVRKAWCSYTVQRWKKSHTAKSSGQDAYPYYEYVEVDTCKELGCRRKGASRHTYNLDLESVDSGEKTHCTTEHGGWDLRTWRAFRAGEKVVGKRAVGYGLRCGTIPTPRLPHEEKRLANDGKPYVYADFVEFYGQKAGQKWSVATPADTSEL